MSPELGHLAVIAALCLSFFQAVIPMVGSFVGHRSWMRLGHSLALGQFVFLGLAFVCLISVFIQDDFSVAYVANNSNTLLPLHYKVSAVWGAHEGSLLLWTLILAGWSGAVALFSGHMTQTFSARVLSILASFLWAFSLFTFTSNPFERLLPVSHGGARFKSAASGLWFNCPPTDALYGICWISCSFCVCNSGTNRRSIR